MRVVAGKYGGRTLKALSGREITRPTTDKVKESIFNMIGPYFDGGRVLDLYAGTGALGIEAVSRGCDFALLVDKNRQAQTVIASNIEMTREPEKFQGLKAPAEKVLQQLTEKFDLVLLDPPYAKEQIEKTLLELTARNLLADDVKIVCETDKTVDLPENVGPLRMTKAKTYGITKITIYQLTEKNLSFSSAEV